MSANRMLRLVPLRHLNYGCAQPMANVFSAQPVRRYWPSRRTEVWDPFQDMDRSMARMCREMDRWSPFGALRHRLFDPSLTGFRTVPVETTEDGKRLYKIALDLGPEFKPEDVEVVAKERTVTVKARRESETNGCKQLREFSYQYSLPEDVNIEQIRSLLTSDGQLTIEAPLPDLKEAPVTEIPVQKSTDTKK